MSTSFDSHCNHENTSRDVCATLSARMFMCGRCNAQTTVCSCCDRGNVYCPECRTIARKEARQRTAKRYQKSYIGRSNHAERQRQYQERQRRLEKKVTHQGSTSVANVLSHADRPKVVEQHAELPHYEHLNAIICDYCEGVCSKFIRRDFFARVC